ncbi:putative sirohydrochlorin ferrochelatase [Rosa chinensis]|uniref:Putative sirohydrochlorin ferrochelatase n=1 Tax=Rosa chinensis TaxID=74649 RepID=A0A2P6PCM9_ROSCH|nr:putative sirohydrochlorin ferrochelatase [Rosa chinensis]
MVHGLWLMLSIRPQVILCNGPGTCVPLCVIAFLFKVVGIRWSSVFYVESIARVQRLSLSGLLLYKLCIADQFFVPLLEIWPIATAPIGTSTHLWLMKNLLISCQCSILVYSTHLHRSVSDSLYDCPSRTRVLSIGTGNGGLGQTNPHGVGNRDGGVIIDHGSRRKESNLMLNEFVDMFRERTGYAIELADPSIQDVFNSCVEQGANRVIVSPFFLLPGRHWKQDIPSLTAEAAKEHPGVSYMVTAPLGLHPLLVDVMNDRINHCLSHVAGDASECAVCVGTGKWQLH